MLNSRKKEERKMHFEKYVLLFEYRGFHFSATLCEQTDQI